MVKGYLEPTELEIMPGKNKNKYWWRSKQIEYGLNPYYTVFTSRNWILNEVTFSQLLWTLTLMKLLGIWNSPSEAATMWTDNK